MYKIFPSEINNRILDFIYGDMKTAFANHKSKLGLTPTMLQVEIVKKRMIKEFGEYLINTKIAYESIHSKKRFETLLTFTWCPTFKGPPGVIVGHGYSASPFSYETLNAFEFCTPIPFANIAEYDQSYYDGIVYHESIEDFVHDVAEEHRMWICSA